MALNKRIELNNGIILNYHRIVSINKITNNSNIIEVASYISEKQREKEKEYYNNTDESKNFDIFIYTTYINKEYSENETIEDCYKYLKTLDEFKDSNDII